MNASHQRRSELCSERASVLPRELNTQVIEKTNPFTESLLDQLDSLSVTDEGGEKDTAQLPQEGADLSVQQEDLETITVQFSVNTRIPKESAGKWSSEQKQDLARYLAIYSTRCVGEFQKFEWGCGAFMTQAFQDPKNPEVIRAHVTALDKQFVYSSDDYTKEKFIEIFGQEVFNHLKKGWPRKHASTLHEKLIDFDSAPSGGSRPVGSFEHGSGLGEPKAEEPKIVEI
jgi:hypothetical protein